MSVKDGGSHATRCTERVRRVAFLCLALKMMPTSAYLMGS